MDPVTLTLLLGRLGRLTDSMTTEICAAADTTPSEIRVLALLVHADDGVARPSDVARFVVQTSGGLTATLNRLEQQALIERHPDPADGRGRLVVITDAGRSLYDAVLGRLSEATSTALAGLDLEQVGPQILELIVALEAASSMPSSAGFVAVPIGVPA